MKSPHLPSREGEGQSGLAPALQAGALEEIDRMEKEEGK